MDMNNHVGMIIPMHAYKLLFTPDCMQRVT